jgi:hypothetical protein
LETLGGGTEPLVLALEELVEGEGLEAVRLARLGRRAGFRMLNTAVVMARIEREVLVPARLDRARGHSKMGAIGGP